MLNDGRLAPGELRIVEETPPYADYVWAVRTNTSEDLVARLRDAFLRSLLIYANTGGFDGNYTIEPRMRRLRETLMKTADEVSEQVITDVLIEDIAWQQGS